MGSTAWLQSGSAPTVISVWVTRVVVNVCRGTRHLQSIISGNRNSNFQVYGEVDGALLATGPYFAVTGVLDVKVRGTTGVLSGTNGVIVGVETVRAGAGATAVGDGTGRLFNSEFSEAPVSGSGAGGCRSALLIPDFCFDEHVTGYSGNDQSRDKAPVALSMASARTRLRRPAIGVASLLVLPRLRLLFLGCL